MKLIANADPDNLVLCGRAAKWLDSLGPQQKDGIVCYDSGSGDGRRLCFYAKRNKRSITVTQIGPV